MAEPHGSAEMRSPLNARYRTNDPTEATGPLSLVDLAHGDAAEVVTEHYDICLTRQDPRPLYDDGVPMPCDCRLIERLGLRP